MASKPIGLQSRHNTKEEIEKRKQAEDKIKGNDNLVYQVPKSITDKKQKELYLNLVEELRATGILNNLDIELLKQTVNAIVQMEGANKLIKKYGQVIQKADGSLQKNPSINVYKDFYGVYYQSCNQLGLSPVARAKIASANVSAKEDSEDTLLNILGN